ncbi:group II intron reverse transcriptase/maturase [Microbulbifer sp. A4B17]|uniref:group II intron reverse transcriptase/maturase n=1 Tax=Microbulbifer sp. A4B17 TaxID=359370 RepID=UPI000D52BFEA|nr:group II intron reverse transcriptase/maturase [Microbulbifer sp. A4B17]AWF80773.1 group II intron reverse transcriptase/maturase [Microbulbifer sp. A4B17]AWF82149.1 group II intron reverse transcriptase/maturase [Microbulbifer sp. A4B17]
MSYSATNRVINPEGEELTISAKPFNIPKRAVWEAWKQIKANGGGAGIDGITIEQYESNLARNLFKLWNRLSSGSYFPSAVKRVDIPKLDGSLRPLGIPTIEDRIAQMVVKQLLEPELEKVFHPDSYGYRPGKSAIDAVRRARQRCWDRIWVVDLDIKGFFDNINHELLLKALDKHNNHRWVRLYVQRWLTAPVQHRDGQLEERTQGTPQGGVISPLLANLFLHYALDVWMVRTHKEIPFERYADDAVYHCRNPREADRLLAALKARLTSCGLEAHPEKTRKVYCKNSNRKDNHPVIHFDFLGYRFGPRKAKNRHGQTFTAFGPSMSPKAFKRIKDKVRQWRVINWVDRSLSEMAQALNPAIQGWLNYYGHFGRKYGVYRLQKYLDQTLMRWARKKFKHLKRSCFKSWAFIGKVRQQMRGLFAHWRMGRLKMC